MDKKEGWGVAAVLSLLAIAGPAWADHASAGFSEDGEGPIQTMSADTLPNGKWGASVNVEYHRFRRMSDEQLKNFAEQGRSVHSMDYLFSSSLSLGYGLTDDLTFSARIPYMKRSNIREGELTGDGDTEVGQHGSSDGLGDLVLLGKWRVMKEPVEISPILGVKFPTGDTHEKDRSGARFETEHQPGSGSWDGLFGLALTKHAGKWTWSASGLYTLVTQGAQDTNLGDRAILGIGAAYRLYQSGGQELPHEADPLHEHHHHEGEPHHHEGARSHPRMAADLVLEGLWEHEGAQVVRGVKDPESGGSTFWIAPGLRLSFKGWSWSTSVGVPVAQDLNGAEHKSEVKVLSTFSTSF